MGRILGFVVGPSTGGWTRLSNSGNFGRGLGHNVEGAAADGKDKDSYKHQLESKKRIEIGFKGAE